MRTLSWVSSGHPSAVLPINAMGQRREPLWSTVGIRNELNGGWGTTTYNLQRPGMGISLAAETCKNAGMVSSCRSITRVDTHLGMCHQPEDNGAQAPVQFTCEQVSRRNLHTQVYMRRRFSLDIGPLGSRTTSPYQKDKRGDCRLLQCCTYPSRYLPVKPQNPILLDVSLVWSCSYYHGV